MRSGKLLRVRMSSGVRTYFPTIVRRLERLGIKKKRRYGGTLMAIVQAAGIFLIFAVCVALMMARKLPTILALPIMAAGISLVAGIPFISSSADFTIANDVLEAGAMRMSTAIAGLIFGGWFGKILTKVGVTHTIIRKAAELAGDKPLPIALAFPGSTPAEIIMGMMIVPTRMIMPRPLEAAKIREHTSRKASAMGRGLSPASSAALRVAWTAAAMAAAGDGIVWNVDVSRLQRTLAAQGAYLEL